MSKQIDPLPIAWVFEYLLWADILGELQEILQQIIEDQYQYISDHEQDIIDQEYWFNGDE